MKVVINQCYGGFRISTKALKELVIRGAKCVKSYTLKHYYGGEGTHFKRTDWEEKWNKDFLSYKDIGDGFFANENGFNIFKDGILYDIERDDETRSDKDLVEVVEMFGKEANGEFAKLKVVEIPKGIDFEISDYDGFESVHEAHRTWN